MARPRQGRGAPPQATQDAADVSLVHVDDTLPGLSRVRRGARFAYRASDGSWLRDRAELERIRRLAIPPAYTAVWICPLANGHLQATGRDARGRKQYRYHAQWRANRDDDKYARLRAFGAALPRIRARVARDLRSPGTSLTRERVLATLVRLLDTTFVRVGNDAYARGNDSYGLTTLRNRHASVRGSALALRFRGKSGIVQQVALDDPAVARVVRRCQQLPGQELFQHEDEDGSVRTLGSGDVNDYLHAAAGARYTAKDFRTWHGSVQALELTRVGCAASADAARAGPTVQQVLGEVARRLGNTVAVCRKAYVHPRVLELLGRAAREPRQVAEHCAALAVAPRRGLGAAELRLLGLLEAADAPAARARPALAPTATSRSRRVDQLPDRDTAVGSRPNGARQPAGR